MGWVWSTVSRSLTLVLEYTFLFFFKFPTLLKFSIKKIDSLFCLFSPSVFLNILTSHFNTLTAESNIRIICKLAFVLFCQSHHLAYLVIFYWMSFIVSNNCRDFRQCSCPPKSIPPFLGCPNTVRSWYFNAVKNWSGSRLFCSFSKNTFI